MWAPALLLVLLALHAAWAERGTSSAELAHEKAGAAVGAREGRDLAREEREDASGLNRREQKEEKRLERELKVQESDGARTNHVILSRADRREDAKENRLVSMVHKWCELAFVLWRAAHHGTAHDRSTRRSVQRSRLRRLSGRLKKCSGTRV